MIKLMLRRLLLLEVGLYSIIAVVFDLGVV